MPAASRVISVVTRYASLPDLAGRYYLSGCANQHGKLVYGDHKQVHIWRNLPALTAENRACIAVLTGTPFRELSGLVI